MYLTRSGPGTLSIANCATVFGAWEEPSGKSQLIPHSPSIPRFEMPRTVPSQIVALIDEHFPDAEAAPNFNVANDKAPTLTAIVQLVRDVPEELLQISGSDYSDLVLGVSRLEYMAKFWLARGNRPFPQNVRRNVHALSIVRQALCKCPDQAPSPETTGLLFIADDELRNSIRQDISSAYSNLHSGEWKGATVLAGSAAEALLLSAIQDRKTEQEVAAVLPPFAAGPQPVSPRDPNPETWSLHEYIEVALALDLITEETAIQTRLGKGFRNLVHPGRAKRLGQTCHRATALSAIAAVEHIVRNLG